MLSFEEQVAQERTEATCRLASVRGLTLDRNVTARGTLFTFIDPEGERIRGRRFPDPRKALADACSILRSQRPDFADA